MAGPWSRRMRSVRSFPAEAMALFFFLIAVFLVGGEVAGAGALEESEQVGPRRSLLNRNTQEFGMKIVDQFPEKLSYQSRLSLAVRYEHLAYLKVKLEKELQKVAELEKQLYQLSAGKRKGRFYSGWEATSDEWWVDVVRRNPQWESSETIEGVPGSYVLSDTASYACMLVLKDVCHFNYDRVDGGLGGYWYSKNNYDLSKLMQTKDLCGWGRRGLRNPVHEIDRAHVKAGEFLSPKRFMELSVPPGKSSLEGVPTWHVDSGLCAPHDSFPGHFIEHVGPLAELAASLAEALNRPLGEPIFANLTIQFSSNHWVRTFGRGVTKIIFGNVINYVQGKRRAGDAHVCYGEAAFPLNADFEGGAGSERFKQSAYKLVTESYVGVAVPPKLEPNYQVTWLWRASSRTILNAPDVLRVLESVFSGIPIQMLEFAPQQPLVEVIDTMRRTAFAFGMHGQSFANEIFLPSGSIALELLPWKMEYEHYRSIGTRFGVKWEQWHNKHFANTSFRKDCFKPRWLHWSPKQCRESQACYHCIKTHSNTKVHLKELEAKLREIEPHVRGWIAAQQRAGGAS